MNFGVVARLCTEKLEKVLGNDREHLNVDTVELIEATPGAGSGETLEEGGDHCVGHVTRAVEDDALLGESLSQILGRLSLSRAGRTSRSST